MSVCHAIKAQKCSDFRFNERLTYLSRRFSVFLPWFRWFSQQNLYLKTLKPQFSPWWHSFLPVTQFYDIAATHTKRLRGTLYSVHIMLYMACRVHSSIEYNLRSFFLLFLPPSPPLQIFILCTKAEGSYLYRSKRNLYELCRQKLNPPPADNGGREGR